MADSTSTRRRLRGRRLPVAVGIGASFAAAAALVTAPTTAEAAPESTRSAGSAATTARAGLAAAQRIPDLVPGKKPPQFVVVSFDGACKKELFEHYLALGKQVDGHFTYFLSGLCLVPDAKAKLYRPPNKRPGSSAIGFADAALVPARIELLRRAYLSGNEIGSHFLGHFCDARGVGSWTSAQWRSEISQFDYFLDNARQINGLTRLKPLPFTSSIIKGGRTPCLAGKRSAMYPEFVRAGFVYDASNGGSLTWPRKVRGYDLWNFPLQNIKVLGYPGRRNLSMDYNFLVTQNGGRTTGSPDVCRRAEASTYRSYMSALAAVHGGNRAPFFIGNHFNNWLCGAYKNSLTRFVRDAHAKYPDVYFVSNIELVRWLERQNPQALRALQARPAQTY